MPQYSGVFFLRFVPPKCPPKYKKCPPFNTCLTNQRITSMMAYWEDKDFKFLF